jgi:hypothetical protein
MAGSTVAPLDRVGWRTRTRPQSGLAHVLGAGAGIFVVAATEHLVIKIAGDNSTLPGILLNVALILVALAVALAPLGPGRAAAVVVLVFATPILWIFVFYGNHQLGSGWFRAIYLLSAAMYLVFYSLLWTRGRAIFLALALLFVASWVQFEIHRQVESPKSAEAIVVSPGALGSDVGLVIGGPASQSPTDVFAVVVRNVEPNTGNGQAGAALGLGVIYLGVGCLLIRKRYLGAAVPFLVIGAIEGFAGALVLGANEGSPTLRGLLLAAVGLILGLAATGNSRRGSVWIGVIAIVIGFSGAIADWTSDSLGRAGYEALIAIGLLAVAWFLMRPLQEAPDGAEPGR